MAGLGVENRCGVLRTLGCSLVVQHKSSWLFWKHAWIEMERLEPDYRVIPECTRVCSWWGELPRKPDKQAAVAFRTDAEDECLGFTMVGLASGVKARPTKSKPESRR